MHLGVITTSFPRFEGDIPGLFVLGFCRALRRRGHQISVLCPEPADELPAPELAGVDVRWVPYLRPRSLQRTFYGAGVLDNLRGDPRAALGVAPFLVAMTAAGARHLKPCDALVSHWALPCALIAGLLAEQRRHLAVLHSADVALLERLPARSGLAGRIARGADQLLFSSMELRGRFGASLSPKARASAMAKSHVCAMGIDPQPPPATSRASLRRALGLTRFTLLSMGRLIALKGLDQLIEAVAHVAAVELIVAGDGPERARLERLAARLGARVRFLGVVKGADKQAWLHSVDALVVSSVVLASGRSEGMPTVILEAMDAGLPVIASRVGGIVDVVSHEDNGLLVPPGDALALCEAIERLRTPQLRTRLVENARATARHYHWDTIAPHLDELLVG